MKTLLLLLIPVFSLAQPKKATKIIVKTDTAGVINKIARVFYENGYGVEQKDAEVGFIATAEKPMIGYSIKIQALLRDSAVVFTSTIALDVEIKIFDSALERTFDQVYYGGMKGSALRKTWDETKRIAQVIGTEISYEK